MFQRALPREAGRDRLARDHVAGRRSPLARSRRVLKFAQRTKSSWKDVLALACMHRQTKTRTFCRCTSPILNTSMRHVRNNVHLNLSNVQANELRSIVYIMVYWVHDYHSMRSCCSMKSHLCTPTCTTIIGYYRTGNICCRVTRNAGGCGVTRDQAGATNFRWVRNARPAGCGDLFIAVCTAQEKMMRQKQRNDAAIAKKWCGNSKKRTAAI